MGLGVFIHGPLRSVPHKGVGSRVTSGLSERVWVPAFAGKAGEGNKAPFGASRHFPQRGKISPFKIFPLWGKYRRSRGRGFLNKALTQSSPTGEG